MPSSEYTHIHVATRILLTQEEIIPQSIQDGYVRELTEEEKKFTQHFQPSTDKEYH